MPATAIPFHKPSRRLLAWALACATAFGLHAQAGSAQMANTVSTGIFARVGDSSISHDEYNAAFAAATRAKFYHGKPPDAEIASMQREVADQLVARALLLREVQRRGLRPDAAAVQKQLAVYEQRYASSPQWKAQRAQVLPGLQARLEQDTVLEQFEKTVRDQAQPTPQQARAYFHAHRDKFTEPEQMRVSVILLRVDPSSPSAAWKDSEAQAKTLTRRLRSGEDFAALARQHSAEASAARGGDMGYLHSGMLPEGSQAALEKMKAGEISEPQRLLEGFAVFRLVDRKLSVAHSWDDVHLRAQQLAQREMADQAWEALVRDLKAKTLVQVDQSRFLPLANRDGTGFVRSPNRAKPLFAPCLQNASA